MTRPLLARLKRALAALSRASLRDDQAPRQPLGLPQADTLGMGEAPREPILRGKVKPLAWEDRPNRAPEARSPFGTFYLRCGPNGLWWWELFHGGVIDRCGPFYTAQGVRDEAERHWQFRASDFWNHVELPTPDAAFADAPAPSSGTAPRITPRAILMPPEFFEEVDRGKP